MARACSTCALRAPASNKVCRRIAPYAQKRLLVANRRFRLNAEVPESPVRVMLGKNAATATPIWALDAAIRRSDAAISGRRSKSADGISDGITGTAITASVGGI